MKAIVGILFSILTLNHVKLSANTHFSFYGFDNQLVVDFFEDKETATTFSNLTIKLKAALSNSSSNNQLPKKNKKKNRKGVKPVYYCLPISSVLFFVSSDRDRIFTGKDSELSFCFLGNGKRGPPIY